MFDTAAAAARNCAAAALPWQPPLAAFARFADDPGIAFLYSSGGEGPRSQFSYLCLDPLHTLRDSNGCVTLDATPVAADIFTAMKTTLHSRTGGEAPVPFSGGAVGFFGYEIGARAENIDCFQGRPHEPPDAHFAIYDTLVAWDHAAKRAWLIAPERKMHSVRMRWRSAVPPQPLLPKLHWRQDVTHRDHKGRILRAKDYIRAGDIYQANITAPFAARRPPGSTAASIFLTLVQANPAPFSAYIDCGNGCAVASVSPERFIRLDASGPLETRPIKGTAKRGATPAEDAASAAALCASEKDRAENLMIVDLMRNDLSRLSQPGSVRVPSLNALESFASVHHLVSAVTATLRPGLGPLDVLRAALPGGSITGAPKIRAMQIIAELERRRRGPYCGTAAWIGYDGAMDSNILIRTLTITPSEIVAQAGGGIVADSDPDAEWAELIAKILPMLLALGVVADDIR